MYAWLTPNAPSGSPVGRVLYIPVEYLPSVNGALEQLRETYNWEQYGSQTPEQAAAAMGDMIDAYYESVPMDDVGGRYQEIPVWNPYSVSSAWTLTAHTNAWGGGYWTPSSVAAGNYVEFYTELTTGTWKLSILAARRSSSGIVTMSISGVTISQRDLYSASAQWTVVTDFDTFVAGAAGGWIIRMAVNTKNGSSSGYQMPLMGVAMRRVSE